MAAKSVNLTRGLLFLLLLWVCYRYLLRVSLTYFPNSDTASPLLAAEDMLRGNWTLRGWWLSTDFFWLTDKPFYMMGLALKGLTPLLMHAIPTAIYVGVLAIVAFAVLSPLSALSGSPSQTKGIAVLAAVTPLLFPSDVLGQFALTGEYHIAVIGFVLGSFLMMHYAVIGGRKHGFTGRVMAAAGILAAAIIGDPMALWIGAVPAIVVSSFLVSGHPTRLRGPALIPASVAITAWLTAKIVLRILLFLRGFPLVSGQRAAFVDFSHLGANLSQFVQGILELFGANFFGLPASLSVLPVLLRLLGCLAVMTSIVVTLRNAPKRDDPLSLLLAAGATIIAAAFLFSEVATNAFATPIWSARYLVPLVIFGCVLLGRRLRRVQLPAVLMERAIVVSALALVVMGFYALTPITRLRHPAAAVAGLSSVGDWPSVNALGSWLTANGLRVGYGSYWAASIVTVATRGDVIVRPVRAETYSEAALKHFEDEIRPMQWYAKCSWYRDPAARFVVAGDNWENLNLRTVTFTFGRPTATHTVAGHTVFVWDRPIRLEPVAAHTNPRRQWILHRLMKISSKFRFIQPLIESPCE